MAAVTGKRKADRTALAPCMKKKKAIPVLSWVDLPGCIWENIMERLPLADYIWFGAVSRGWRSVQSNHRRRHLPFPPPMANHAWFISETPDRNGTVLCIDPFPFFPSSDNEDHVPVQEEEEEEETDKREEDAEKKAILREKEGKQQMPPPCQYRVKIPLPKRMGKGGGRRGDDPIAHFTPLSNGWFLLDGRPAGWDGNGNRFPPGYHLVLFNPLTDRQIHLPVIKGNNPSFRTLLTAAGSYPPAPGGQDMALLLAMQHDDGAIRLRLFRTNQDQYWHYLPCKEFDDPEIRFVMVTLAFCQGKFYCMYDSSGLVIVDPRPEIPQLYTIDMDVSALPKLPGYRLGTHPPPLNQYWNDSLGEHNGQLLLVMYSITYEPYAESFYVFTADLDRKSWVKVNSLGDHSLFVYGEGFLSLVAADVGVRENCVYVVNANGDDKAGPWIGFDVDNGEATTDAPLGWAAPPNTHLMFVPSIY